MRNEIRISEVTLENYRQYYGTVKVTFPTEPNTFSVIVGANGAGKSNFWNAIHWCLFGEEPHIKSSSAPSIINIACLSEAEKADTTKLTTSVKIVVESGDTKYLIRRSITGLLHRLERDDNNTLVMSSEDPVPSGFEVTDRDKQTLFQRSRESGRWETLSDRHDFDSLVGEYIIPKNLARYFILDGEFLQDLLDRFGSIKSGIDQISQIHVLNDALELMEKTRFQYKPRGSRKAGDIWAEIDSMEHFLNSENRHGVVETSSTEVIFGTDEPMHASGNPRKKDLEQSIMAMRARLRELDREIAVSDAINRTQMKKQYNNRRDEEKDVRKRLDRLVDEYLKRLITIGPFIMCKPSVESATSLIRAEIKKGKIPNIPRRMLVNELLDRHECLCGTRLDDGTGARRLVEEQMRHITYEAQYDIANNVLHHNDRLLKDFDSTLKSADAEMVEIRDTRLRLTKLGEEVRRLRQDLPKDDELYARLINERYSLEKERDSFNQELGQLKTDIAARTAQVGDLKRKLLSIATHAGEEREANLLFGKSDIIKGKMREIKEDAERVTRKRVSDRTMKILNSLSWKNDYTSLTIDDEYGLRVTNDAGLEVVGGLSAGEKLFLALSFIMALKHVTGYRFPFVIDSPLGKTGGSLRLRFGKHMPELLNGSQLIMLATNTEYNDTPISLEDGGSEPSLIELLKSEVYIQEYNIDYDKVRNTANISRIGRT